MTIAKKEVEFIQIQIDAFTTSLNTKVLHCTGDYHLCNIFGKHADKYKKTIKEYKHKLEQFIVEDD